MVFSFSCSLAGDTCQGKFVNPITEVAWGCVLPIHIGPVKINSMGSGAKARDTKNPSCPICFCTKDKIPMVPGIPLGFWEPVRMIEITRTPFCMVNIGGINLGADDNEKMGGYQKGCDKNLSHKSYYHVHYYFYPLIALLEVIADLGCMDKGSIDVLYMSEFDPMWNDELLQNLMYPDSFLFGNPVFQASCIADCVKASFGFPLDFMFWCAGCLGNMYPIGGVNADHIGGVKTSILLSMRVINKMHRAGLAHDTSTSSCKIDGPLCRSSRRWFIKKSQYKLQMVYPKYKNDNNACIPLGMTDLLYSMGKEFPYRGQDWGYILWRKRNCCFF